MKAQSHDELLYNLHELRPADAIRSFRRSIIEDYPGRGTCAYCGRTPKKFTLDHIIPRSKGGPTRRWNLSRACVNCNGNKSNNDLLPWYRPQQFWAQEREQTVFEWMGENSRLASMKALTEGLAEGRLDTEALQDLTRKTAHDRYWDDFCDRYPSSAECRIYDV
jgi:hypothetical protein